MASSTTNPIDNTIPNKVNTLIEKPTKYIKKKTPIKLTGMAVNGMMVERQSLKNKNIIIVTNKIAVNIVSSTSIIDRLT